MNWRQRWECAQIREVGRGILQHHFEPTVINGAHADLAEAYLSRGDRGKAAKMLDELGRLWKDADPDLPLVKRTIRLQKRIQEGNR